ncbi:unnamed protein product [Gordionus sp. m RMFG-2023]
MAFSALLRKVASNSKDVRKAARSSMTIEDIYNLGLEEDTTEPSDIKGVMKVEAIHLTESPGIQEVNHMGRVKNSYVITKPIQVSHAHGKSLIKQPQFINDNRPDNISMNFTMYAATIAVTNDSMDGTVTSKTIVLIKATIIDTITATVSTIATSVVKRLTQYFIRKNIMQALRFSS